MSPTRSAAKSPQKRLFWQPLVFLHHWISVLLCLLMTLWAVSGLVMIYVSFPELSAEEKYAGASPLALEACCNTDFLVPETRISQASLSMHGQRLILTWQDATGAPFRHDLHTGTQLTSITAGEARKIAEIFQQNASATSPDTQDAATSTLTINEDQWTVYGRYRLHRPLHKVSFTSGRHLYVSSTTGEIVQDTTPRERFWNWLGAVPHWLYYTGFRKYQKIWYETVVWTSLVASLTIVLGLYLGLRQYHWRGFKKGNRASRSPYRGVMKLHHITGLIFGSITFTWLLSGFFSMNPFGLMEGGDPRTELSQLTDTPYTSQDLTQFLKRLKEMPQKDILGATLPSGTVSSFTKNFLVTDKTGSVTRISLTDGAPAPVTQTEVEALISKMRPQAATQDINLLTTEDAYYFNHKKSRAFPVWRIKMADKEHTRYYFDADTAQLIRKVDSGSRQYRWFHHGLHRLDFFRGLRSRPLWDGVIVSLMLGVIIVCALGTYLSIRRLYRSIRSLFS